TSWISSTFLNPDIPPNQPNEVVYFKDAPPGDGAPVFPAPAPTEPTANKRPGVIGARLKGGHQVRRATKVIKDNGATWIEIESPATQEVRFIRADAVERGSADIQRTAATEGGLQPSRVPSANVVTESPAELARRAAVAADYSGNYAEAVRQYDGIVARFGATHPQLAKMSRARADYLRNEYNIPGPMPDALQAADRGGPNPVTAPVSMGGSRQVSPPRDGNPPPPRPH